MFWSHLGRALEGLKGEGLAVEGLEVEGVEVKNWEERGPVEAR